MSMQTPKKASAKHTHKPCKKCGKEIYGWVSLLYCPECKAIRKKEWWENHKKKIVKKADSLNLFVKLPGGKHTLNCKLCGVPYEIIADNSDPGSKYGNNGHQHNIYPAFCEEHRNEWRRKLYEKNRKAVEANEAKTGTDK